MKSAPLTRSAPPATSQTMANRGRQGGIWGRRALGAVAMVVAGAVALGGCVSVNAPDKPIVIELNINIKQEVVYRLAGDASKTIENTPGIF